MIDEMTNDHAPVSDGHAAFRREVDTCPQRTANKELARGNPSGWHGACSCTARGTMLDTALLELPCEDLIARLVSRLGPAFLLLHYMPIFYYMPVKKYF
jgi:hypothetical protein